MNLTLYTAPLSSALPVVHALEELDVPHERVVLDLQAGDQRRPEFLALNPNGKVPALVVDGTPMFEALAIIQWLGDRYGVARGLWPAPDAPERREAMAWSTWMYVSFSSVFKRLFLASNDRADPALHHAGQAAAAQTELADLLRVLDERLAGRDHLVGEQFTLADLMVASGLTYATFAGVRTEGYDHIEAWLECFHARPAYQRVWAME